MEHTRRIDKLREGSSSFRVVGDYAVGVSAAILVDVGNGLVDVLHDFHGHTKIRILSSQGLVARLVSEAGA